MLSPRSTKVPLGSNVDLKYMTPYPSKTLVLRGEQVLKKWYIIMVYAKLNIHRTIA